MHFFNRRGYTIDQTILIVAIIAILITLVIVTLGWTLLSRTSGSKLGSFTDQLSQAVNVYYGSQHVFPTTIAQLDGQGLVKFRNSGGTYYHDIGGATGTVSVANDATVVDTSYNIGTTGVAATYLVATFTAVPASEANEALKTINGSTTSKGHLVSLNNDTDTCINSKMSARAGAAATATGTVCFIAQKVS